MQRKINVYKKGIEALWEGKQERWGYILTLWAGAIFKEESEEVNKKLNQTIRTGDD